MGLTFQSTGFGVSDEMFEVRKEHPDDIVVALAGNPNTGKSTVFNNLTGLKQHTGNWPGKTVSNAQGHYKHRGKNFVLVDLPGTYSLLSNSVEEEVARDFICFGKPHVTVVVTDATSLERNLNLVLQILEITRDVVVCVNLMDEANRKKINIDIDSLEDILGVPVVATSARSGHGLEELKDTIAELAESGGLEGDIIIEYDEAIEEAIDIVKAYLDSLDLVDLNSRWASLRLIEGDQALLEAINKHMESHIEQEGVLERKMGQAKEMLYLKGLDEDGFRDSVVYSIVKKAEAMADKVVAFEKEDYNRKDQRIDNILTSRVWEFL